MVRAAVVPRRQVHAADDSYGGRSVRRMTWRRICAADRSCGGWFVWRMVRVADDSCGRFVWQVRAAAGSLGVELSEVMVGVFIDKLSELAGSHLSEEPMGKVLSGKMGIALDMLYPVLFFDIDIAVVIIDFHDGRRGGIS